MKTILATIAIALATITSANAQDKEAHCFKAAELEIEAEVIAEEAATHRSDAIWQENEVKAFEATDPHDRITQILADKVRETKVIPRLNEARSLEAKAHRLRKQAEAHRRKCEGN